MLGKGKGGHMATRFSIISSYTLRPRNIPIRSCATMIEVVVHFACRLRASAHHTHHLLQVHVCKQMCTCASVRVVSKEQGAEVGYMATPELCAFEESSHQPF